MKSIENYSNKIDRLKDEMRDADAVFIGAGAGLSTAAGETHYKKGKIIALKKVCFHPMCILLQLHVQFYFFQMKTVHLTHVLN